MNTERTTIIVLLMRALLRLRRRRQRWWKKRDKKKVKLAANRRRRDREKSLVRSLKNRPCTDCGLFFGIDHMEFDHLPRYEKSFSLGDGRHKSYKRIEEEAAKCEIVCCKCHQTRELARGRNHGGGRKCPNFGLDLLPIPWPTPTGVSLREVPRSSS